MESVHIVALLLFSNLLNRMNFLISISGESLNQVPACPLRQNHVWCGIDWNMTVLKISEFKKP